MVQEVSLYLNNHHYLVRDHRIYSGYAIYLLCSPMLLYAVLTLAVKRNANPLHFIVHLLTELAVYTAVPWVWLISLHACVIHTVTIEMAGANSCGVNMRTRIPTTHAYIRKRKCLIFRIMWHYRNATKRFAHEALGQSTHASVKQLQVTLCFN